MSDACSHDHQISNSLKGMLSLATLAIERRLRYPKSATPGGRGRFLRFSRALVDGVGVLHIPLYPGIT